MNTTLNQANTTLPKSVDNSITDMIDIQDALTTARTFLSDTINEIIEPYRNPKKLDMDTLSLMWYSLQRHEPYISAAVDYINNAMNTVERSYENLRDTHKRLNELGALFVGGADDE